MPFLQITSGQGGNSNTVAFPQVAPQSTAPVSQTSLKILWFTEFAIFQGEVENCPCLETSKSKNYTKLGVTRCSFRGAEML